MVKAYFDCIREKILEKIDKADKKIIVAIYWFTNYDLFQKLISKLEQGIKVELIVHNDYVNNREAGLPFQRFIDNGGELYFSSTINPMHNKFCVIDNKILINGSYNWTYYAEDRNRENILLIEEEQNIIDAFEQEFERLKALTQRVLKIVPLSAFEVDEYNLLRARDYLANDIVYQVNATGNRHLLQSAFQIAPENIEVQTTAFKLNLTKRYKLKSSIGSSLHGDKYLIIIPKGTFIPVIKSEIVQTVFDNQTSVGSTIYYGENTQASKNSKVASMKIDNLPRKPAGQAKLKYHASIDLYGNLKIEKFSLDNGEKQEITKIVFDLMQDEDLYI